MDAARVLTPAQSPGRLIRRRVDRSRARDPCVRAAVVALRRRQGAGDPGVVRAVGHPLLPGAQCAHRPAGLTRCRPDARQAAAPAPHQPAAGARGAPLRGSGLIRPVPGFSTVALRRCGLAAGALAACRHRPWRGRAPTSARFVCFGRHGLDSRSLRLRRGPTSRRRPAFLDVTATAPTIAVVGDAAGASSLVRSLRAAGLHAALSDAPRAGTLGRVNVPTVLYRPAAGAAAVAARVAAVLSTRLPGTTVEPTLRSTDASSVRRRAAARGAVTRHV